jgi:hypothetical protein
MKKGRMLVPPEQCHGIPTASHRQYSGISPHICCAKQLPGDSARALYGTVLHYSEPEEDSPLYIFMMEYEIA